jgi:hypothetical protein
MPLNCCKPTESIQGYSRSRSVLLSFTHSRIRNSSFIRPQALPNSGVGMALFAAFVDPTVPAIVPNPIVPTPGVGPRSQLPSAVAAKVCVNTTNATLVVPSTVNRLPQVPTVGDCVGARVTAAPPPGATACAVAKERRARIERRR